MGLFLIADYLHVTRSVFHDKHCCMSRQWQVLLWVSNPAECLLPCSYTIVMSAGNLSVVTEVL